MSKQNVIKNAKQYATLANRILPLKMLILQEGYPGDVDNPDGIIDLVLVVDFLDDDQDYVQLKLKLENLAEQIDPRIDIEIVEQEKTDPTGFYNSVLKTGEVIYNNS